MYKDRRLLTIFCSLYTIAAIVALMLTGCAADNSTLTGSRPAVVFADAMPGTTLTPATTDRPEMTRSTVVDERAVDGLNTEINDSVEIVLMSTMEEKSVRVGDDLSGLQVYRDRYCGTCHELTAAQTSGTFGPSHDEASLLAETRIQDASYTGNATTAAGYIRESLLDPTAYLVPDYAVTYMKMPPFTHLKDEEIDALVVFLLEQK